MFAVRAFSLILDINKAVQRTPVFAQGNLEKEGIKWILTDWLKIKYHPLFYVIYIWRKNSLYRIYI